MSDTRMSGDAWVTAADGSRYWGVFGAGGLLAYDPVRGVLLQHRVSWSDHGGTWGIPGGALQQHETPIEGALRESAEEADVPPHSIRPVFTVRLDHTVWSYTTVVAHVTEPFTPRITDAESHELRWVPVNEVSTYPLHPAFSAAWPLLRVLLREDPVCVISCTGEPSPGTEHAVADLLDCTVFSVEHFPLSHLQSSLGEYLITQIFPRIILITPADTNRVPTDPSTLGIEQVHCFPVESLSTATTHYAQSYAQQGSPVLVITDDPHIHAELSLGSIDSRISTNMSDFTISASSD